MPPTKVFTKPPRGPMTLIHQLWLAQGGLCFHCGEPMLKHVPGNYFKRWTREHLWPRSKFPTEYGSIVLAHKACNNARRDQLPTNAELDRAAALYASFDPRVKVRNAAD